MGWKAVIAVAPGARVADLPKVGWTPTGETDSADEAASTTYEGIAALEQPGRLVLLGGVDLMESVESFRGLGEVYLAMMMSTVDMYQWRVLRPGGDRDLMYSEGSLVNDEGEPLAEEQSLGELGEDELFELLQRTTGFVIDEAFMTADAQVIEQVSATDLLPPSGPTGIEEQTGRGRWNPFRKR